MSRESRLADFKWRMVITAGMGFFTDAYDLFIIGVVTTLLMPIWHLSVTQLSILNAASLAAAAFGAIFFGKLSDYFGRKKTYGFEILVLFIGSLLSAFTQSFTQLLVARIIVGFGIGGDYPTSAVVASEHSTTKNRGFLVLLVFAMQALGLVVGPMFASALLAMNVPHAIAWRILLGIGALPAAIVFFMRRRIKETRSYANFKAQQTPVEVSRAVSAFAGFREKTVSYTKEKLFGKKWLKYLAATAGSWFLLDVAFYGNGVSSVLILKTFSKHQDLLSHTILSALMFLCFAVPGYYLAAKYVDILGRKFLQKLGFAVMAICYAMIALIHGMTQEIVPFVLVFGISFFFVNFGPNTTTFLIPSELFPTSIRAQGHGISAAIGKVGAFLGAFALPIFLSHYGLHWTMGLMSVVAFLGIFTTIPLKEMKRQDLEKTESVPEQIDMLDQQ